MHPLGHYSESCNRINSKEFEHENDSPTNKYFILLIYFFESIQTSSKII